MHQSQVVCLTFDPKLCSQSSQGWRRQRSDTTCWWRSPGASQRRLSAASGGEARWPRPQPAATTVLWLPASTTPVCPQFTSGYRLPAATRWGRRPSVGCLSMFLFLLLCDWHSLAFVFHSFFFIVRWHQAAMWAPTPATCRASPLGARRTIWEYLQVPTRAVCSCSAVERGAEWRVRLPCFSSVSSPRAGGEEEEEEEPCFHPSGLSRRIADETRKDTKLHCRCGWDFRFSSRETDEQFLISSICYKLTLQFMLQLTF